MKTKWTINASQSDVLLKSRHTTIGFMGGNETNFDGFVNLNGNDIEDASLSFSMTLNDLLQMDQSDKNFQQLLHHYNTTEVPVLTFKSTSFQKINKNINFFKGALTIKDVTKVVELQAEYIDADLYNGTQKVAFEITGNINRKDFGLQDNVLKQKNGFTLGKDIDFIGNFEFKM
ncbi:YceI family protein [Flavobacterium agrisoli]|uniref:YceI family protein n=1 Tax=Flavobacterium agrisoli TaxID=2793066 RepID=A0A934UJC8_9FLAO|nr:YceI family protein [Flavobacterium agrisoli]MBK0369363.1 YceI family protein [Flavobacterium agrisoli]